MASADPEADPPPRNRRLLGVALVIVLALGATALLVRERRALAESIAVGRLRALGVPDATLRVERLDTRGAVARDVRAGGGALSIDAVEVDYHLAGLVAGRADAVRIRSLRVEATLDRDGLTLAPTGAGEGGAAGEEGGGAGWEGERTAAAPRLELPVLPVDSLVVEDARLDLATPYGAVTVTGDADLRAGPPRARASLALEHAALRGDARVTLGEREAGRPPEGELVLELAASGALAPVLAVEGGALAVDARLEVRDGAVEIWPRDCVRVGADALSWVGAFALARPFHACIESEEGPLLRVAPDAEGLAVEAAARTRPEPFAISVGADGSRLRFEGRTPTLHVRTQRTPGGETPSLRLRSEGGLISVAGLAGEGIEIEASLPGGGAAPTGTLRVIDIRDGTSPARFAPWRFDGRFRPDASDGLALSFALVDQRGRLRIEGESAVSEAGTAGVSFRVPPVAFDPAGLQPGDLSPALRSVVWDVDGTVEARGALRMEEEGITGAVDLVLLDLDFVTEGAEFELVNGAVRIDGPWPPSTPPAQFVSMARVDFGLELTDGLVSFRLVSPDEAEIESAEWRFAGGVIRSAGIVDLAAEEQKIALEVSGVEVPQLVALVDLPGLVATGTLAGEIPVVRTPETFEIRGARLAAVGPGQLSYRPDPGISALGRRQSGLQTLFAALERFEYETLELSLDGDAGGLLDLQLHLAGANPDFQDGRRVEFNLSLESRLGDLLRQEIAAYGVPEVVRERLRSFDAAP